MGDENDVKMCTFGDSTRVLPRFSDEYLPALIASWRGSADAKWAEYADRMMAENPELGFLLQDIVDENEHLENLSFHAGAVYVYAFLTHAAEVEQLERHA
jgi:hypothetical protein